MINRESNIVTSSQEKPYLLLLRGLIRDSRHWYGFDQLLQQKIPHCEVILWDFPKAVSRSNIREYSHPAYLAEQLLAQIGPKRSFHIVGVSLGGLLGLYVQLQEPKRCLSLMMINSSHIRCSLWYQRISWFFVLRFLIKRCVGRNASERYLLKSTIRNQHIAEKLIPTALQYQKDKAWTYQNALYQLFFAMRMRRIPTKSEKTSQKWNIWVVYSDKDRIVSAICSKKLALLLQAKSIGHPAAGHDLAADDPQWCIQQIQNMILQHPSTREVHATNKDIDT